MAIPAALLALGLVLVSCDIFFNEKGPEQGSNTETAYTVSFDAYGGSGTAPEPITVKAGSSITIPGRNGLTMSEHAFGGWYDADKGNSYRAGDRFTPTDDTILYAIWEYSPIIIIYYTVTFDDANGGSIWGTWTAEHEAGSSITLPDVDHMAMSRFTFGGWNTNADGTGTAYRNAASFTLTGDITLYAVWNPNPGTETNPIPLTENIWADGEIINPNYSTNESDFAMWYSLGVESGTTYYVWWNSVYRGDGTYAENETKSLYSYVSALYSDGTNIFTEIEAGWETPQSFTADRNGTVLIKVSAPEYYSSYYYSTPGTFSVVYNTSGARPTSTVTLYPNYRDNPDYFEQGVVQAGSSMTFPVHYIGLKSGYTISGWYDNASGTGMNYDADESYTPTGDITLYATWGYDSEPIPLIENIWTDGSITSTAGSGAVWYSFDVTSGTTYYVWWNNRDEGINVPNSYNTRIKTLACSVSAYYYGDESGIFESLYTGWTTPRSFTADRDGTVLIMVAAGYYATGTFGLMYNTGGTRPILVAFLANGVYAYGGSGTAPSDHTVTGDSITLPDENGMTINTFTFGGWNTKEDGTGITHPAGSSFTTTSDTILYALWVPNPGTSGISLGLDQIIDGAPIISSITISRTGNNYPVTYPVSVRASDYDEGSIEWKIAGVGIYADQTITGGRGGTEANPFPLTADTWTDDSITSTAGDSDIWYSFNVTSGTTYYVWWNDVNQGNSTKTLDVRVSAAYIGGTSTSIFASTDYAWATPRSFTANRTGAVLIRVTPYYNGGTGSFAVTYSAGSTRPDESNRIGSGDIDIGEFFTLNALDVRYNSLGGHTLTLTVRKNGQRYQRAIPFTIVP